MGENLTRRDENVYLPRTNLQPTKADCQEKNLPLSPHNGAKVCCKPAESVSLPISLTRFLHGLALDTMTCTIQPIGLYVTASYVWLVTLSFHRARQAPEDHRYRTGLIHLGARDGLVGLTSYFRDTGPGRSKAKETGEGSSSQSLAQGSSQKFCRDGCFPYMPMSQIEAPLCILFRPEEYSRQPGQVCEQ